MVESLGGGVKSLAASTEGDYTCVASIFVYSLSTFLLTEVLPFPEPFVKSVHQSEDRVLEPKLSRGTRGLTSAYEDALATRGLLLESEGMRFGDVTYVDPTSTRVGKEVVACRVGLCTVSYVVVEYCSGGIERGGVGDFMDGWLWW